MRSRLYVFILIIHLYACVILFASFLGSRLYVFILIIFCMRASFYLRHYFVEDVRVRRSCETSYESILLVLRVEDVRYKQSEQLVVVILF